MPGASQRSKTPWSPWARQYARTPERYVFGTAPSDFALEVARLVRPGDYVLDLGCGEGRDRVFFAGRGAVVFGVDVSEAGLAKARRLARCRAVRVRWVHGPAHLVFTDRMVHEKKGEIVEYYNAGELREAFVDWQIPKRGEHVISCAQDGTVHGHAVEEIVAARPVGPESWPSGT
jgi:SAM-dependent methyltransferase